MNCELMHERISARLAGELTAAEREDLEAHLEQCAACSERALELERLWSDLGDVPVPSERMRTRMNVLIERESKIVPRRRFGHVERLAPLAATLALGIGLGYVWGGDGRGEVAELRGEVAELRGEATDLHAAVAASLLGQSSVSARLRGVAYTRDLDRDGDAVTEALLHTLREDPDVNVRLAAIEALVPPLGRSARQDELVSAVATQSSPLVQLSLIDALLDSGDEAVRRSSNDCWTIPVWTFRFALIFATGL